MKVLLTGASGFLGRHVLDALHNARIEVVVLGRTRPAGIAEPSFIAADLLVTQDLAPCMHAAGASHLLHLAWVTEHGRYWTSPENLRWVEATLRLVQAFCESGGQHVVVAGTCAEYAWDERPCREDDTALLPGTLYGTAKDATRRLLEALCVQEQVRFAWGRIFFPFGPGEGAARLLPRLIEALKGRAAPFGVGVAARRDFLYASDVAQALVTLVQGAAAGCFNIGSGEATAVGELVRMLARLLERDPRCVLGQAAERATGPSLLLADNCKLRALGWQPQFTLEQGLENMVLLHESAMKMKARGEVSCAE
ncbi:MAG: NAD(P)-dependent oxidoreductase [Burkholderiaceae bacterium]